MHRQFILLEIFKPPKQYLADNTSVRKFWRIVFSLLSSCFAFAVVKILLTTGDVGIYFFRLIWRRSYFLVDDYRSLIKSWNFADDLLQALERDGWSAYAHQIFWSVNSPLDRPEDNPNDIWLIFNDKID